MTVGTIAALWNSYYVYKRAKVAYAPHKLINSLNCVPIRFFQELNSMIEMSAKEIKEMWQTKEKSTVNQLNNKYRNIFQQNFHINILNWIVSWRINHFDFSFLWRMRFHIQISYIIIYQLYYYMCHIKCVILNMLCHSNRLLTILSKYHGRNIWTFMHKREFHW